MNEFDRSIMASVLPLTEAAGLALRHPRWVVWSGCPAATRVGTLETVTAEDYPALDRALTLADRMMP